MFANLIRNYGSAVIVGVFIGTSLTTGLVAGVGAWVFLNSDLISSAPERAYALLLDAQHLLALPGAEGGAEGTETLTAQGSHHAQAHQSSGGGSSNRTRKNSNTNASATGTGDDAETVTMLTEVVRELRRDMKQLETRVVDLEDQLRE